MRQYATTLTLSRRDVRDLMHTANVIYRTGIKEMNKDLLISRISATNTLISLIFLKSNKVALATAVIGLLLNMSVNEKQMLTNLFIDGMSFCEDLFYFMDENPEYDLVRVELPFVEYKFDGEPVRFVCGEGVVKRVHTEDGWISLE